MAGQTTEIAKMIVTLGMDTSKLEQGSNSTSQQMDKLGATISKSFIKGQLAVKALSLALDGVKKAGAAVWNTFTKTIGDSQKAFASFEQLEGGAKLMFGQAFDAVAKNAQDAWQTVQMSQNEYLQQANGFATGLKTALGGNEQAAADLAHKIIVAQADVVSATGNSREAVQNAFNGIMKSNYTMLDNLQLGIKPTKEGFQEMIDSVNAWNAANGEATNYQIDNLADAQAALVDYIEMQGLAGYASSEAAGTIEGATASVKATWENVKVSLAGGGADITSSFEALGTAATSWITNVVPRIGTIMGGIGEAMAKTIPGIGEKMIAVIPTVVPKFVAGGLKLGVGLVKGIGQGLKVLWALLKETWNQLGKVLEGLGLKKLGENILRSIWDGIKIGWNDMLAWVYEVIGSLITAIEGWLNEKLGKLAELPILKDLLKDFKNVDLGGGALQGKSESRKTAADQLRDQQTVIMGEIQDTLEDFSGDLFDKCDDILEKEDGISGQVKQAGTDITGAINDSGTSNTEKTAYDVVQELMKQWQPGTYDDNLAREIQAALDLLQSDNFWVHNAELINTGEIPPEVAAYLKTHSADEVYKQIDEAGLKNTISGVETAVDGLELDPTINVETPAVDMTDVTGLVTNVNSLITQFNNANSEEERQKLANQISDAVSQLSITAPEIDTTGVVSAIEGLKVEPSIKATVKIPEIKVPEAEVNINTDTSILDATAANLDTSATNLGDSGAAGSLTTSATDLKTAAGAIGNGSTYKTTDPNIAAWTDDGYADYFSDVFSQEEPLTPNVEPIPEEVIVSYQSFATAIGDIVTALNGGEGEEGATLGLTGALGGLPDLFSNILSAAQPLAGFFGGGMVAGIKTLMQHLCQATVDEEGNASGAGGNTLYTALGLVFTLFEDILATSQLLAAYWTGGFISASEKMRTEAGLATGVVEGLGVAAQGTAAQFFELTNQIYNAVDAYLALLRVKGTGKGGGNGKSVIDAKASGGPVRGGSTYLVGEHGPEIFTPNRSGYIIPNEDLRASGDQGIRIEVNGNIYGESYLKDYVVKLMTGQIRKELRLAQ